MQFENYYNIQKDLELINENEQLNEAGGLMNIFYSLTGKQKKVVSPDKYMSFVIGSKGYANLLNMFAKSVLDTKDGKKPKKQKIYVTNILEGVPPKIAKLENMKVKMNNGEIVNFWYPVEKVNNVSVYTTNMSVVGFLTGTTASAVGDIVLWDVMTKDDFSDSEDANKLSQLGWEEGANQFVLSVNERGKKFWMQLTGMTLEAWVKQSKIGAVTDPYGFALRDDISLAKKQALKKTLNYATIDKNLYNKLIPSVKESVKYVNEAEKLMAMDDNGDWKTYNKADRKLYPKTKFPSTDTYVAGILNNGVWTKDDTLQDELDDYISGNTTKPIVQPKVNAIPKIDTNLITSKLSDEVVETKPIKGAAQDAMESGYRYTFRNGGNAYVYTVKNAPDENSKYKIAYDTKAASIMSKIPELNDIINKVDTSKLK